MTGDRDYERPDDWFAARSDEDDRGADDAAADDAAPEFTWGLRPSGDLTSAVTPSMDEVLNAPSPRRAAREATAREAACHGPAATGDRSDSATGDRSERIAATPVSPGVVPSALLSSDASGLESLFGAGGIDMTAPVVPLLPLPNESDYAGTPTARRTRKASAARASAREKRGFTSKQILIALLVLLAAVLVVIVLFALGSAGARAAGPDVESLQIGTLIPGIGR